MEDTSEKGIQPPTEKAEEEPTARIIEKPSEMRMEEDPTKNVEISAERDMEVPIEKDVDETTEYSESAEREIAKPNERNIEETTRKELEEEANSSHSSSPLTTPLLLAVIASILAILSGVLLHYSSFFGGTLAVAFTCSLIYAVYRIITVEKLAVKNCVVQLLGLSVPLLAALAAISALPEIPVAVQLPPVMNALNLLLISAVWMHLALLKRTSEQFNQFALLGYSLTLIVASVVGTGYIWGRWGWEPRAFGFPHGFATCLVIVYAMVPLIHSTFRLRDKLPISAMETGALLMSFLGGAACIAAHFYAPALLPGSILATVLCSILYAGLDFLEHQMRLPQEQWTEATETRSVCHVAIKVVPLLTIALWAGMGAIGSWAIRADIAERVAACGTPNYEKCRKGDRVFAVAMFAVLAASGHAAMFDTLSRMREKEPPLCDGQQFHRKSLCTIAAVVALLLMKVAIACFCLVFPNAIVPAWVVTTIIGSLYLLVSLFLDSMRAHLLRYNIKLLLVSIGVGLYLLATGLYMSNTHSEDDPRPILAVFVTGAFICLLLAHHFGLAFEEQFKKKKKFKKNPAYFSGGQIEEISISERVKPDAVVPISSSASVVPQYIYASSRCTVTLYDEPAEDVYPETTFHVGRYPGSSGNFQKITDTSAISYTCTCTRV